MRFEGRGGAGGGLDAKGSGEPMYFFIVIATTIVLPIGSALIELWLSLQPLVDQQISVYPDFSGVVITLLGKWYVFWAGGVRLFLAGLRQTIRPGQTLTDIFEIDHPPAGQIVRELGFANLSTGLLCMLSLLIPILSPAGAITAGVFYGLAGIAHATSGKAHNAERTLAMLTDLLVAAVLLAYVLAWLWLTAAA